MDGPDKILSRSVNVISAISIITINLQQDIIFLSYMISLSNKFNNIFLLCFACKILKNMPSYAYTTVLAYYVITVLSSLDINHKNYYYFGFYLLKEIEKF